MKITPRYSKKKTIPADKTVFAFFGGGKSLCFTLHWLIVYFWLEVMDQSFRSGYESAQNVIRIMAYQKVSILHLGCPLCLLSSAPLLECFSHSTLIVVFGRSQHGSSFVLLKSVLDQWKRRSRLQKCRNKLCFDWNESILSQLNFFDCR